MKYCLLVWVLPEKSGNQTEDADDTLRRLLAREERPVRAEFVYFSASADWQAGCKRDHDR